MKIFINRLYLLKRYLVVALMLFVLSCGDDDEVTYSESGAIIQKVTDPYLQIKTPVVAFQAGIEKYGLKINVINGLKAIEQVKVYSIFTDAVSGKESNEVLFTTYEVESDTRSIVVDSITYLDLKAGLTVNGNPLPADEKELAVGSGWKFRFEGITASGEVIPLGGAVNVGVLSRFAGLYRVVQSQYWRIGVPTAVWTGQIRFIGSVDETTFSYNDFWGNFAWTGQSFQFKINFTDNTITVPTSTAIFSGNRALRCDVEASTFTMAPCTGSNVFIPNETTGKHRMILTYGYFTDGSGSREFYETLEKI